MWPAQRSPSPVDRRAGDVSSAWTVVAKSLIALACCGPLALSGLSTAAAWQTGAGDELADVIAYLARQESPAKPGRFAAPSVRLTRVAAPGR